MAKTHVQAMAKTSVSDNRPDNELKLVDLYFITQSNFGTWEAYFELYDEGKRWVDIYPQYACGVRINFKINNQSYQYQSSPANFNVQGIPSEASVPDKDTIYIIPGTNNIELCKR